MKIGDTFSCRTVDAFGLVQVELGAWKLCLNLNIDAVFICFLNFLNVSNQNQSRVKMLETIKFGLPKPKDL